MEDSKHLRLCQGCQTNTLFWKVCIKDFNCCLARHVGKADRSNDFKLCWTMMKNCVCYDNCGKCLMFQWCFFIGSNIATIQYITTSLFPVCPKFRMCYYSIMQISTLLHFEKKALDTKIWPFRTHHFFIMLFPLQKSTSDTQRKQL